MWSVTSVDQVFVGERWWPSGHRTEGERDPFPWADGPATGSERAGPDRLTVAGSMLRVIARSLPVGRARRLRTRLIRAAGFPGIATSATFLDVPTILGVEAGAARITIGPGSFVNAGCSFGLGDTITLADHVYLGARVHLVTSTADVDADADADADAGIDRVRRGERRQAAAAISVGSGAWLGPGAVVCPGVRIGARAIVAAGTLVTEDVPADTMVAGAPATIVRQLTTT